VRVSFLFWDAGEEGGSILDTTVLIDPRDLTFSAESDGRRKAVFDVLALIYGGESKPLDTFDKRYTVALTDPAYQKALAEGLVQRLQLRLKKPGFVEVPDLTHGKLTLSGIALQDGSQKGDAAERPILVRCHRGQTVFYAYHVINAHPDPTGAMNVEVSATLYRESKALGTSQPVPVNGKNQPDPKRRLVSSDFRLGHTFSLETARCREAR
jgi:hypothetical protein